MSYIGRQLNNLSDRVKLDSITASATATYNLLLNTVAYVPSSAESLTVSLNGVIQAPQDSYTVSGSTITFASTLSASDSIDFILAERSITLQTPSSGSVNTEQLADSSVTLAKLSATGTKDSTTFLRGDNTFATAGGDNTPSFGATASSTQSISNGGFVKVTLDTENWDTDSAFDNATNYRFTVPTGEGGKYLFNYGAYLVTMTTNGYFQLQLYKNGSQLRESAQRAYMSSTTSASMNIVGSITTSLAAGDYIEFYVIQDNSDGGGGSRTLSDANYKPFLTGFKLIGV